MSFAPWMHEGREVRPREVVSVHPEKLEGVYEEIWLRLKQNPDYKPLADAEQRAEAAIARVAKLEAENARLGAISADLHWMARRYADGRQSYATSLHNENTRALLAMGVELNPRADGTLWARDSAGRAYDGLTEEEAAQGRQPDWKHDDKERRIEEQDKLLAECRDIMLPFLERYDSWNPISEEYRAPSDRVFANLRGLMTRLEASGCATQETGL